MRTQRIAAIVASLVCAAGGAVLAAAGCGGSGTTPVCLYDDGAIDPEAGCGTPIEASVLSDSADDGVMDQAAQSTEDAATDTNLPPATDASEGGNVDVDADAHVVDANEDAHDAHIVDAHSDAKG